MKATIEAISPLGFKVWFEIEGDGGLEAALSWLADIGGALAEAGYKISDELRTPDGLPICRKHQAVMRKREKQGDTWFSHVVEVNGVELYCKGRPGRDSPGWEF